MSSWNTILFDLDGTLTESAPGITNGVATALKAFGIDESPKNLMHFVGPPLHESFMQFYQFSREDALEAVRIFRSYYKTQGWLENAPYPGIVSMLSTLKQHGKKLCVATSKPQEQAIRIADHFRMSPYFEFVCGADPADPDSSRKSDVIFNALRKVGAEPDHIVMVGDRKFDVTGAHEFGLPAVGVLYGYGSKEEFAAAGADYVVSSVSELSNLLDK